MTAMAAQEDTKTPGQPADMADEVTMTVEQRLDRIEELMRKGSMEVMGPKELAIYLDKTPAQIRTLVEKQEIPYYLSDGRHRFRKKEIDAWLMGELGIRVPPESELETARQNKELLRENKHLLEIANRHGYDYDRKKKKVVKLGRPRRG